MASPQHPIAASRTTRLAELVLATLSQSGLTFAQQGIVVVGVFFVVAYHLTLAQMGLVVSFASMGWMAAGIFTGILVDRLGPRVILLFGTLVMCGAALVISAVGNLAVICGLLFALGMGVSTASLAGSVTVLTAWSPAERGLPMGIRQMGVPVGSMTAAFILPTLTLQLGLPVIFRIFAVELLILGVCFWAILPPRAHATLSHPSATRGDLRRDLRRVALPCFVGFLLAWGQYVLLTFTIPMLHNQGGLSVALAGVVLALAQIGGAAARIGLGFLSDHLGGRHDLVLIGSGVAGTLLAVTVGLLPARLPLVALLILWLALGMALVGWNGLLITWTGERVAVHHSGAGIGLTTSFVLLGAIVSAPIMGLLIQATGSYASAWLALGAILAVATATLWWNGQRSSSAQEIGLTHDQIAGQ